jgi:cytochrome c oxidase subunit IV
MQTISFGGILYPHFGQSVVNDAMTLVLSIWRLIYSLDTLSCYSDFFRYHSLGYILPKPN